MSSCSVKPPLEARGKPVKVNGVVVSRALISREVQNHPAGSPAAAWRAASLALVVREALTQEAARRGVTAEPRTDGAGRRETPEEAAMRALVEEEARVPEPTLEECRRYYERNLARFRSSTLYEAAHILFAAPRTDEDRYGLARVAAQAALDALRVAPQDFASLAATHSACPSARLGGHLGQVAAGATTPEFHAALAAMEPGTLCAAPVETRYGVHVVRLDRRIDGGLLPFELVHGRIASYLAEAVRRRAEAQYVARLLAAARIEGLDVPTPADLQVH